MASATSAVDRMVLEMASSGLALRNLMGPLVHDFEEIRVVRIFGGKHLPNQSVAKCMAVRPKMSPSMVIGTDCHYVSDIVCAPTI